jgi:protein-tyrosine phosphatase
MRLHRSRKRRGIRVRYVIVGEPRNSMDMTWVTDRIAVGGGIWVHEKMAELVREGVTHIIDMQIEFDDTPLGRQAGVEVLWNPVDDDFKPKPHDVFQRGVEFALKALEDDAAKVFIHCAAGVHRAPMMTLAVLRAMGWELEDAMELIQGRRYVVDFADVYVQSVERFMRKYEQNDGAAARKKRLRGDTSRTSSEARLTAGLRFLVHEVTAEVECDGAW